MATWPHGVPFYPRVLLGLFACTLICLCVSRRLRASSSVKAAGAATGSGGPHGTEGQEADGDAPKSPQNPHHAAPVTIPSAQQSPTRMAAGLLSADGSKRESEQSHRFDGDDNINPNAAALGSHGTGAGGRGVATFSSSLERDGSMAVVGSLADGPFSSPSNVAAAIAAGASASAGIPIPAPRRSSASASPAATAGELEAGSSVAFSPDEGSVYSARYRRGGTGWGGAGEGGMCSG